MKILAACEESQTVTNAFRERGHEAYSCDILDCSGGHPEWHIKGDVREVLYEKWDMIIAFPPCTYLTVTANKWLKDQPERKSCALVGEARREARREAAAFFMLFTDLDCDKVAIENSVGVMSTIWRPPDQIICPSMFGHSEPKKTCLWLKGLPRLETTDEVKKEYILTESGKQVPKWFFYADRSKGQEERAKIRSKTFPGIANAMADQWTSGYGQMSF